MILRYKKSVTLIELLIAITLMGLVVLAFSSIDLFSRYHVITSDRRAKLQNEVSYILEHMTKEISKAIGDVNQPPVDISSSGNYTTLKVNIDYNQNSKRDSIPPDRSIAYVYISSPDYEMRYYPDYPSTLEIISQKKISGFTPTLTENYVNITITACWDPDGSPVACGTPDNPNVTMSTRIKMPAVSIH